MNPLVEKMLDKTVSNDTQTRLLEQIFEHEVKCESKMHLSKCTESVTHRGEYCLFPEGKNICKDAASYVVAGVEMGAICASCDKFCSECWTIRPI